MTEPFTINTKGLRDLAPDIIDDDGRPRIMPAAYYKDTTVDERAWFGHRYGLYLLPTIELCAYLHARIGKRPAIEVGAGNGTLGAALGIPATDSRLQDRPDIAGLYQVLGQPTIRYGTNVETLEARAAVRKYRPQVVVASWLTHRYNRRRHARGGNIYGPDLNAIIEQVDEFIFIGNRHVHRHHSILELPHDSIEPPWLYSRKQNDTADFIGVWTT